MPAPRRPVSGGNCRLVRDVLLGRRLPLLQVTQDFRRLVIQRADESVIRAAAFEPDPFIADQQYAGEAPHLRERGVCLVAVGTKGGDVPVDAVPAQWLAGARQRLPGRER